MGSSQALRDTMVLDKHQTPHACNLIISSYARTEMPSGTLLSPNLEIELANMSVGAAKTKRRRARLGVLWLRNLTKTVSLSYKHGNFILNANKVS